MYETCFNRELINLLMNTIFFIVWRMTHFKQILLIYNKTCWLRMEIKFYQMSTRVGNIVALLNICLKSQKNYFFAPMKLNICSIYRLICLWDIIWLNDPTLISFNVKIFFVYHLSRLLMVYFIKLLFVYSMFIMFVPSFLIICLILFVLMLFSL